jgi:hypothetical protein
VHVLDRGFGTLIGVIEFPQSFVIVLGPQQLFAFDAERLDMSSVFCVTLV